MASIYESSESPYGECGETGDDGTATSLYASFARVVSKHLLEQTKGGCSIESVDNSTILHGVFGKDWKKLRTRVQLIFEGIIQRKPLIKLDDMTATYISDVLAKMDELFPQSTGASASSRQSHS